MVKELDDAPREDITVVLDLDPGGVAGPPGGSSFDAAVRAAGAIALAHVLRGRRVAIVGTAPAPARCTSEREATTGRWRSTCSPQSSPLPGATVERAFTLRRRRSHGPARSSSSRGAPAGPSRRCSSSGAAAGPSRSSRSTPRPSPGGRGAAPIRRSLRAASRGIPVAVVSADTPLEVALAAQPVGAVGA